MSDVTTIHSKEKFITTVSILKENNVLLYMDPRHTKAIVPSDYKDDQQLILEYGMNMSVPVSEFSVDEDGIGGTLTFNRQPVYCWAPWESIFLITISGTTKGRVWEESFPKDHKVAQEIKVARVRSTFKSLPGGKQDDETSDNLEPKRNHLRLV